MDRKKSAYVETYGCQMNISDGELMEGILEERGYRIVESPEGADVVLVNTCAIREHAEQRVLGRVAQLNGLREERPELILGVTGCMAQRMGESLLERAPYVDLVMGPDGYRRLPAELARLEGRPEHGAGEWPATGEADPAGPAPGPPEPAGRPGAGDGAGTAGAVAAGGVVRTASSRRPRSRGRSRRGVQLAVLEMDPRENYQGLEQRRASGVAAWVPIQRGCDHRCTYCIVPYVRGPEKNRTPESVLSEVREIAHGGITEVTLLGQTVNSYRHGEWSFAHLLREVARVPGIRRVRFTSPHPNDVTPELVEVMATEPAVCEHLHLPVQAGNDRTLKRMVRRYTVESFLEKVDLVRGRLPDVALSTDIIVAFPGETEEEFRDTLDLVRRVRFDEAFTYKYSAREGTPATRLPEADFVDPAVAQQRLEELIEVSRGLQAEINRGEVGRTEEVLVEKPARGPGQMLGRTRRYKAVAFPGSSELAGRYLRVTLTGTTGATFTGCPVSVPPLAESA